MAIAEKISPEAHITEQAPSGGSQRIPYALGRFRKPVHHQDAAKRSEVQRRSGPGCTGADDKHINLVHAEFNA